MIEMEGARERVRESRSKREQETRLGRALGINAKIGFRAEWDWHFEERCHLMYMLIGSLWLFCEMMLAGIKAIALEKVRKGEIIDIF